MRNLVLAGVLTWVLIAIPTVMEGVGLPWALCYIGFLVLFLLATRDTCTGAREWFLVVAQSLLALICIALEPDAFQPVLLVIVAGELGHLRVPVALTGIGLQSVLLGAIVASMEAGIQVAMAYFTFQLFGYFASRIAHEEREARQALAEANAELRVATGLLDLSSRAEERLRIARDLHDLIGHHLTALSINLEVASHLAEGAATAPSRHEQLLAQIEKSRSLTKLLLSDVRDVVSRLRENEPVDLGAALQSLREAVPSPAIHVDTDGVSVTEPAVAQTALRAVQEIVTNAVRHANARNLWLKIGTVDDTLTVDARDDGAGTDRVVFGNGLRGMRERVQQAGGTLQVASMRGRGFEVHVRVPL